MTNVNRIVGKEIRKRRKHLGLSGFELANLVGVSQQQISRYETGKTSLTIDQLSQLLNILDKNWVELIMFVQNEHDFDIKMAKEESNKKNYLLSNYLMDNFLNKK
ncbi:helix-turn-helix transcriptional regulator [Providencia rettgeri]|uniref:helix-turn-helix domain-containing protein n=1 Tax=Providencia rettgeri TaxID=587 RepID=UPI00197F78E6|nr:helix-turn-helix transcriptional regulator [Providencia rettgeri]MBN6351717.1 helix-turn-helix transcriptional regulator [Providencia rettgeri]MBQ0330577.1 helix-turn-helix transcriptional regulator [Providencia rettgeri]